MKKIPMRPQIIAILITLILVLSGCESTGVETASKTKSDMAGMSRADLERLIRTNVVHLPYDESETGFKWRIGFLLDSETIIGPLAAHLVDLRDSSEGSNFIVATVQRKGEWDSSVARTRRLNECSFTSKLDPQNEEAATLKIGSPANYLDGPVIIASQTEQRAFSRTGTLTDLFRDADSGETYLKISIKASSGDIGGFVLGPDGNLLGAVCDSDLTSKDGLSIAALSAPDFIAHLEANGESGNEPGVPEHYLSENELSKLSDDDICKLTLSTKVGAPNWDGRSFARKSVNEAKRRGLTPEACAKLLGRQAVQVKEAPPKEGNIEERLTKLKNLYDKGLITKEEYENKQAEILEGL